MSHPAYEPMRRAVEVLGTHPGPIQVRLQAAERYFAQTRDNAQPGSAESNLYHRIGSSLVEGGADREEQADRYDERTAVADSIAALDESRAIEIAQDMLHFFELIAGIADSKASWLWPRH